MLQDEKSPLHRLFQFLDKFRATAAKQKGRPSVAIENHDFFRFNLVNFELRRGTQIFILKMVSIPDNSGSSSFCCRLELFGSYAMHSENSLPALLLDDTIHYLRHTYHDLDS